MRIRIEKLVYGGAGMARTDEGVIFVEKVLPGELVEVEIVDKKKDYANARLVEVLEAAPERRPPVCPNFETVGCCDWNHITYERQLEIKESIIRESLSRLGRIDWERPIERVTGPEREYRMRATFRVENQRLGFVEEKTNRVVPLTECAAMMPALNQFVRDATQALTRPELNGTETVRAIVSPESGEVAATFHRGRERASWTKRLPVTQVMGMEYRLRPDSFFQPNRFLLEPILSEVLRASGNSKLVLDLFCGSAFFSLPLARTASKVIGVDRRSAANAKWNARHNQIENVEFVKSSAWAFLMKRRIRPDTVVLNPPRTGAGKNIVKKVASLEPSKIVYVSCNPTTFATETRLLLDNSYQLSSFKFIDQFPNTHHIETIASFERICG